MEMVSYYFTTVSLFEHLVDYEVTCHGLITFFFIFPKGFKWIAQFL